MSKLIATFKGTGSTLYLGLGFIPAKVCIKNISSATLEQIDWSEEMRATAVTPQGIFSDATPSRSALTAGNGIEPYYGWDIIGTPSSAYQIPAHMVDSVAGDMRGKGTGGLVDTWVLDTEANRTGSFNAGVDTNLVGVGSIVRIRERREGRLFVSRIAALTNDGDAADEVTLQEAVPSGAVESITYPYGFANAPTTKNMPEGIIIKETSDVNVADEICILEAYA